MSRAVGFALLAGLVLAGCAGGPKLRSTAVAPAAAVRPAEPLASRAGFAEADLAPALAAFRRSCPSLLERADASGLTQPGDWVAACAAANSATDVRAFFTTALAPVVIGDGRGLNTGYFEPELAGSRTPGTGYPVPFYRRPSDLAEIDLGTFTPDLAGKKLRGRVAGGSFVPYYDRAAIEDGALAGRGLELAWATDAYEAFFLEIQGSGRLRLADGSVMRIGYASQNGRGYTAIGKLLRDRGVFAPGQATMENIIGWMRANPDAGRALMRENKSYVFFRELKTSPDLGPDGAMGVPLTPEVSVAADPKTLPLGAPVWLDTIVGAAPLRRMMVAQDTGGAIRGPNRLDIFWGPGDRARSIAGSLSATGSAVVLLPVATVARLSPAAATGERLRRGPPPAP